MGIRLVSTTTGALSTAGTSLSFSHDGGSGSNRLLVVAVTTRVTTATVSSLTYNGVALTSVGAINQSTFVRTELWRLIAPATGSNTVAITVATSSAIAAYARTFEDVHQTTPLGTAATAASASTTPSVTVVASTNDVAIDALGFSNSSQSIVAIGDEQGQQVTVISDIGSSANGCGLAGSTQPGAATSGLSWTTLTSATYASVGVALKPTGTGTTLARVSQVVAETLSQPTTQRARVSQLAVEILYPYDLPPAPAGVRRTQVVVAG